MRGNRAGNRIRRGRWKASRVYGIVSVLVGKPKVDEHWLSPKELDEKGKDYEVLSIGV